MHAHTHTMNKQDKMSPPGTRTPIVMFPEKINITDK